MELLPNEEKINLYIKNNFSKLAEDSIFRKKCLVDEDRDKRDRIMVWLLQSGDKESSLLLLQNYIPYIAKIIYSDFDLKKYRKKYIDASDLLQTGIIGAIEAMNKYDFRKDVKVRTYVSNMVKYSIRNSFRNFDSMTISREAKSIYSKYVNKFGDIEINISDDRIKEMTSDYGFSAQKIKESLLAVKNANLVYSYELDGHINCDEKTMNKCNMKLYSEYEQRYNDFTDFTAVIECLSKLKPVEKYVMTQIYFKDVTQKELAKNMHKSVAYICKTKKKSIDKIRKMLSIEI